MNGLTDQQREDLRRRLLAMREALGSRSQGTSQDVRPVSVDEPRDTGDFRLISRQVVEVIKRMPERDRFIRGMVSWVGFRQHALSYDRAERFAGESKYPWKKMQVFAIDGILSFSIKPLRLSTATGFFVSGLAVIGIVYALAMRLLTNSWVSGWTLLIISVLFMGGVQLICLGIIGEYVGRIYSENKRRPTSSMNHSDSVLWMRGSPIGAISIRGQGGCNVYDPNQTVIATF